MRVRGWHLSVLLAFIGIVISINWIDLPLTRYLAQFRGAQRIFTSSELTQPVMIVVAFAGLMLGLGHLALGRKLPRFAEAAMLAGLALLFSEALTHGLLKPFFGRTVPRFYLWTGRSGFHPLHWGKVFGSFPSGHSTQAAALLTIAWAYSPRARWAYVAAFVLLAIALLLGEWHYLSDIIAGALVGSFVAAATLALWKKTQVRVLAGPARPDHDLE